MITLRACGSGVGPNFASFIVQLSEPGVVYCRARTNTNPPSGTWVKSGGFSANVPVAYSDQTVVITGLSSGVAYTASCYGEATAGGNTGATHSTTQQFKTVETDTASFYRVDKGDRMQGYERRVPIAGKVYGYNEEFGENRNPNIYLNA